MLVLTEESTEKTIKKKKSWYDTQHQISITLHISLTTILNLSCYSITLETEEMGREQKMPMGR